MAVRVQLMWPALSDLIDQSLLRRCKHPSHPLDFKTLGAILPGKPPPAFSFSNSASFSAAVPCMSLKSASPKLFLALVSSASATSQPSPGHLSNRLLYGLTKVAREHRVTGGIVVESL